MEPAGSHPNPLGPQVATCARHVFGPVNSRRLGRSLGIDLLPYKTCSLDCIYCECGRTSDLSVERKEFSPPTDVIKEIDEALSEAGHLDSVTFSGSGEPLLHSGIGTILAHLKKRHPTQRTTVLTNATHLSPRRSGTEILIADTVIPSLDSATQAGFEKICRPHSSIRVEDVIDGIVGFRQAYRGTLLLEIFIVPGINDSFEEIEALRQAADLIQPDAIQLNRMDRPGTQSRTPRATDDLLQEIATRFTPHRVDIPPSTTPRKTDETTTRLIADFLAKAGTSSIHQIAEALRARPGDVSKFVQRLIADGSVQETPESPGYIDLPPDSPTKRLTT